MRRHFTYLGLALPLVLVATALAVAPVISQAGIKNAADAAPSKTHEITLAAETLDNGLLAYRMVTTPLTTEQMSTT